MPKPSDNQRAVGEFVHREVICCVSQLVHTLASAYGHTAGHATQPARDLYDLTEQAAELSTPIPDYEEAAREAGWTEADGAWAHPDFDHPEQDAIMACDTTGTEPHEREVFEHWAVTPWLADKLEAHGEKVDRDFAGLTVWARTTTGQVILLDRVICDIFDELHSDKAEG